MLSLFRVLSRPGMWPDVCSHDGGSTAIEYAVIASLVAIAGVTAFRLVGTRVQSTLSNVAQALG